MENDQHDIREMTKAEQVRALANEVRDNPTARGAVADALEIIADAMGGAPCEDCAAKGEARTEEVTA